MSDACEFIDATLAREGSDYRADEDRARYGDGLRYYGASVGAVRGTVRDALRRYRGMRHDDVTALSSELWAEPVFERRLASIVLLQAHVALLRSSDLTRIEGFLRASSVDALVRPLALDVVAPLLDRLDSAERTRAVGVLARWSRESSQGLSRAASLLASGPDIGARSPKSA